MSASVNNPAKGRIAHATRESAPPVEGRRDFFRYRDLGVMEASGGALRAQTMTAIRGMTECGELGGVEYACGASLHAVIFLSNGFRSDRGTVFTL